MSFAQFLAQIVEHLVARRLDLLDQLFHQRVVVIGQPLQHREARLAFRRDLVGGNGDDFARRMLAIDERALQREIDVTDRDAALPDRDLAQQQRRARRGLQHRQMLAHAPGERVDLVEEQEARNAGLLELAQHDLECGELALVRLADDDRRVAGGLALLSCGNSTDPGQSTKVSSHP